jgi:hypothetical protein
MGLNHKERIEHRDGKKTEMPRSILACPPAASERRRNAPRTTKLRLDPFIQKSNSPLIHRPNPCSSAFIRNLKDHVNSVHRVKMKSFFMFTLFLCGLCVRHPVLTLKRFNASTTSAANCLRAKCKGLFHFVARHISTMSCERTGQGNRKKFPHWWGNSSAQKSHILLRNLKGITGPLLICARSVLLVTRNTLNTRFQPQRSRRPQRARSVIVHRFHR